MPRAKKPTTVGRKAYGGSKIVVCLTPAQDDHLDKIRDRIHRDQPGLLLTKTDVMRMLVERDMERDALMEHDNREGR